MDPTPDLDQLMWLFESEPKARVAGDNWQGYWPYSAVRFATDVDDHRITLDLEPAAESVRLRVNRGGDAVADLDLRVAHLGRGVSSFQRRQPTAHNVDDHVGHRRSIHHAESGRCVRR